MIANRNLAHRLAFLDVNDGNDPVVRVGNQESRTVRADVEQAVGRTGTGNPRCQQDSWKEEQSHGMTLKTTSGEGYWSKSGDAEQGKSVTAGTLPNPHMCSQVCLRQGAKSPKSPQIRRL